jgi:anti-sigma B factor antagonist
VRLRGDVDLYSVEQLQGTLAELATCSEVIFDLREVGFIDSSGLGALHRAHREVRARKGRLQVIVSGSRAVERSFELSALASVIEIASPQAGEHRDVR